MVWPRRTHVHAGSGVAAAGRTIARSACSASLRIRRLDAERVRLGVSAIRGGALRRVQAGDGAGFRKPVPAGQNSGFLQASGDELRRKLLPSGSARSVLEYDGRSGVPVVFARGTHQGTESGAVAAAVVGTGLQRG